MSPTGQTLLIGWATCDLTPDEPVLLAGQFHARVSEGVMDPVTATALALEGADGTAVVMVSCDLVGIPDDLRDAVRAELRQALPAVDPRAVFLNATHTHTAPDVHAAAHAPTHDGDAPMWMDLGLPVMAPAAYVAMIAPRLAETIARAWRARRPGGIGFGLGHAVVGHNRRIRYDDGITRMYGNTDDPHFSHVEGSEDHSVNVLATWDAKRTLTGHIA